MIRRAVFSKANLLSRREIRTLRLMFDSSSSQIPHDAWDSHMHVTDTKRYPAAKTATYAPHDATLAQALENGKRLSLPNLVFVQPSFYGTDNSCMLDALRSVGINHGRGVVVVDPKSTKIETLREWHSLGVRGVRVNLKSVNKTLGKDELVELLTQYADLIRPLGTWVLQLFVDMAVVDQLEPVVDKLGGVKLVLDHLGMPPDIKDPLSSMQGWKTMQRLMRNPDVFVKVSAPYRLSSDPGYHDLEALTKELLQVRGGDGVVFASDWPHTRFEGVDAKPWVEKCIEWCENDSTLKDKLFRENAKILWDVD